MKTVNTFPALLIALGASLTLANAETPPTVVFNPSVLIDSTEVEVTHTPVVTGTVTSCVTSPNLPIGLRIHNTTCVISGTPRFETSKSTYSIIAANAAGSNTFVLTISVPKKNTIALPGAILIHTNGIEQTRTFEFQATKGTEKLSLNILDTWGRTIWSKTISPSETETGMVSWNGRSANGHTASAGLYLVRISTLNGGATTHIVRPVVTLRPQ